MPRNTTKEMLNNPLLGLIMGLDGNMSRSIEEQERQGQREVTRPPQGEARISDLPTKGLDPFREGGPYAALGFKIHEPCKGDPLFTQVTLPAGWKVVPTSHSMHNDILDEKGRKRTSFFYKAAFYDRDAHLYSLLSRYQVAMAEDYDTQEGTSVYSYDVIDNANTVDFKDKYGHEYKRGKVLCNFKAEWKQGDSDALGKAVKRWEIQEEVQARAKRWLDATFKDHADPMKYWD